MGNPLDERQMSKLSEQLRTIDVFNAHHLVAEGHPFIWRRAKDAHRCVGAAWMLSIKGKQFKSAPYDDYGSRPFSDLRGRTWREAVVGPLAMCKELFPDLEMVKGPWPNTYVPKCDLEEAKARLKRG